MCCDIRCGDVVWEAQVSSSTLTAAGLQWDEASHSLIPISASQDLSGPGPDSQAAAAAAPGDADVDPADEAEPSAAENGTAAASAAAGSSTDDKEAAAVAAAPAGEWEPGDGEEVVAAASAAAAETHAAATDSNTGAAAGTGPMGVIKSPPGGKMVSKGLQSGGYSLGFRGLWDVNWVCVWEPGACLGSAGTGSISSKLCS